MFAYGMVLFELLSQRSPFEKINFEKRNNEIQDGKRPSLQAKETRTLICLQELMELCWEKDPQNRPTMSQAVEWIRASEFERLRAEIALREMKSISCACVCRILPEYEPDTSFPKSCFDLDSVVDEYDERRASIHQVIPNMLPSVPTDIVDIKSSEGENLSNTGKGIYQFVPTRQQKESGEENRGKVQEQRKAVQHPTPHTQSAATATEGVNEVDDQSIEIAGKGRIIDDDDMGRSFDPYTQIWLCGRGQRKGLLQISTYYDGHPGSSVSA